LFNESLSTKIHHSWKPKQYIVMAWMYVFVNIKPYLNTCHHKLPKKINLKSLYNKVPVCVFKKKNPDMHWQKYKNANSINNWLTQSW
jgi:hypothetical protein